MFVHYIQCVSTYNAIVSKAVDTKYVRMLDLFRCLSEVNKEIFVWATGASCTQCEWNIERQEVTCPDDGFVVLRYVSIHVCVEDMRASTPTHVHNKYT